MKLLVVSHTPHHTKAGTIVGWGPTIRELDHLASLVDELVHVAPMYDGIAPDNALPYRSANVRVRRVPASGGETLLAKLGILLAAPAYLRAVHEELKDAGVAHIRCPANISLLTLLLIGVAIVALVLLWRWRLPSALVILAGGLGALLIGLVVQ